MVYYPLGKATGQLNGWNMGQQILIPLRLRAGFGFGCPTSGTVYDQFASLLIEFITQTFTSQNRQYPTPKRGKSGEVASSIPPYDFILIIIVIESPNLRGCDYTVFFFIFFFYVQSQSSSMKGRDSISNIVFILIQIKIFQS